MRLIDADEFSREMYHEAFETDSDLQKWDSGCWIRYKMFENAIENFPAVDAAPVKHGYWIDMGDFEQCSVCNATHLKEFQSYYGDVTWIPSAYCGACGAKMDEPTQSNDSNTLDALGEKVTE